MWLAWHINLLERFEVEYERGTPGIQSTGGRGETDNEGYKNRIELGAGFCRSRSDHNAVAVTRGYVLTYVAAYMTIRPVHPRLLFNQRFIASAVY